MYHEPRQTTPPSMNPHGYFATSADAHYSDPNVYNPFDTSPDTLYNSLTTPPKSPTFSYKPSGPPLLPKIRCQDQVVEPSSGPIRRSRTVTSSALHFPYPPASMQRPMMNSRRATSSPEACDSASPASGFSASSATALTLATSHSSAASLSAATTFAIPSTDGRGMHIAASLSPCESAFSSTLTSPVMMHGNQLQHSLPYATSQSVPPSRRASLAHARAVSMSAVPQRGHSRSESTSSIDEAAIWRHGYPTQYRHIPLYVSAPTIQNISAPSAAPIMQQSYSAGSNNPHNNIMTNLSTLPVDTTFDETLSFPHETTNLMNYLTTCNPSCSQTVRRIVTEKRNKDWFWWDVRTLRSWDSFNISTIMSIAQFPQLLHVPIDVQQLPHPAGIMHPAPETEHNLRAIYNDYFCVKINAALKQTQGTERHLFMSAVNSATTSPTPKPDFISNYVNDVGLKTLSGDRRGRLVGIVKAYNQWNTGMRSQSPPKQVEYLKGLAHLHRVMREHGCRYGFIVTEIELLCVRAGARDDDYAATSSRKPHEGHSMDDGPIPIFGHLETAPPIPLSLRGADPDTHETRLTAALALWYLHMLAKEDPLPGMPRWNMAVSGVAAQTRRTCGERDKWMPKVGQVEMREARRIRGWVMPDDPISRKEYGGRKKRGT